ncbi:hypothetical protein QW71_34605 [Paenibacillus sp. IHB B 3415]|nr:hypothetical protein QW71_34605 [Paenibacillus sp. IHB B 3415]
MKWQIDAGTAAIRCRIAQYQVMPENKGADVHEQTNLLDRLQMAAGRWSRIPLNWSAGSDCRGMAGRNRRMRLSSQMNLINDAVDEARVEVRSEFHRVKSSRSAAEGPELGINLRWPVFR